MGPWTWKIPPRQWPAYWLHNPPEWLFKALRYLPKKVRGWLAETVGEIPGVCGVTWYSIETCDPVVSSPMANRCMRDGAPCWCGRYQTFEEHSRDLERIPDDPFDSVRIEFR